MKSYFDDTFNNLQRIESRYLMTRTLVMNFCIDDEGKLLSGEELLDKIQEDLDGGLENYVLGYIYETGWQGNEEIIDEEKAGVCYNIAISKGFDWVNRFDIFRAIEN